MKKILIILVLIFATTNVSLAATKATPTPAKPTPTPTKTTLQEQVNELQSRIASRVAQLNLVEKKSILGTVIDVSDTQITMKNVQGQTRVVNVDELTKFSSSSSNSFGISDVKNGMFIGVLGLYNKDTEQTQARLIYQETSLPNFIYGAVYSTDNKNFNLIVAKENGAKNIVDVETITKTYVYSSDQLTKSGFSKIQNAQTLIAIGFFDKQNRNEIIASRILLFPEISASPKIDLNQNQPTIIPSTGSGLKVQPIVK